jgi:hypothetical protein
VLIGQLASYLPKVRLRACIDQLIREKHLTMATLARFHVETLLGTLGRAALGEVLAQFVEDERVPMSDFSRLVADLLVAGG